MYISETLLKDYNSHNLDGDAFQLILYALALGLRAKRIYEWGVGQSTFALLRAVHRTTGNVYSCDTDPDRDEFIKKYAEDIIHHWHFHRMNSEAFYYEMKDEEKADLIFIDGDHSYSCISWEVEYFWELLKPEGLMILHDTRDWPEGPGRVLKNLHAAHYEIVELPFAGGIAIAHKRS